MHQSHLEEGKEAHLVIPPFERLGAWVRDEESFLGFNLPVLGGRVREAGGMSSVPGLSRPALTRLRVRVRCCSSVTVSKSA